MTRPLVAEIAQSARDQAHQHPVVLGLLRELPPLPGGGRPRAGLYVDKSHAPAMLANGRLRVSIVRIFSVGPEGARLIGQVQASTPLSEPGQLARIHFYLHDTELSGTVEVHAETAWFVQVLDRHYSNDGAEVGFGNAVDN